MSALFTTLARGTAAALFTAATITAVQAADATHTGRFQKAEAPVSGGFMIKQEMGKRLLVLSGDFRTNERAPDLKVVFSPSTTPLAGSNPPAWPLKPGSYTILAPLKSSKGSQSYVIPSTVNLARQGSVLIWCEKFNATMAWAPLGKPTMMNK